MASERNSGRSSQRLKQPLHSFEELPSQVARTYWKQLWRLQSHSGFNSQGTVYEELAVYLLERGPKDLVELTTLAQQYLVAHKQQLEAKSSLQSSLHVNVPNKENQHSLN